MAQSLKLGDQLAGFFPGEVQAQEFLDLTGKDDDRDAGCEADGDGIGDVFDKRAEPQEAGGKQEPVPLSRLIRPNNRGGASAPERLIRLCMTSAG